ncbi:MAG TPA: ABC transporter substrate-binding protein [Methyloceanibacter sp.]|nr:ABC transporter substrate-binding protein [Methyloceanibacter sp.]
MTIGNLHRLTRRGALALGVGLAVSAAMPLQANAAELVIGVINPLTGPGADLGLAGKQGLDPVISRINAAGGINGMKIRVIYRDDQSNPQKGVAAALELINRHRVDIIMGANLTHVAFAVSPMINKAKVPFIVFGTGSALINVKRFPYSFRFNMSTGVEAAVITRHVVLMRKHMRPGLLVDRTALGQSGRRALETALTKYKIKPVGVETFAMSDTDMTGQLIKLRNAKADVVLVWGLGPMLAHAARSAERIGYKAPVYGGIGMHQSAFLKLAGPAGAKWSATFFRSFTRAEGAPAAYNVQAYVKELEGVYGKGVSSSNMISAVWFDAMNALAAAVKGAKSKKGEAIRAALERIKGYKGLMSTYTFSPTDHDGFDPRDTTLAFALGVKRSIRLRVPNAP